MSDVSVIGLGPMGGALARVLLASGKKVTVWNRRAERAEAYVASGARRAKSVGEAVGASGCLVVCVADYAVSDALLKTEAIVSHLAGKTIVQLSTGSPAQARDAEAWTQAVGAAYVDGAILAVPSQMGTATSTIVASGRESAFRAVEALLATLAGKVVYLGERVGAAAAIDLGVLSHLYGAVLGFYHGARICESEGLSVGAFGATIYDVAPAMAEMMKYEADVIQEARFDGPESSLATSARALRMMVQQAKESGLDASFPSFASGLFERALKQGYGDAALASIIKVLRAA